MNKQGQVVGGTACNGRSEDLEDAARHTTAALSGLERE